MVAKRQPDRVALLESEIARLQHELDILQRQWNRKHYLAVFGLLAIPAFAFFGPLVGGLVLLSTPALIGMQAYLLGVRRLECRQLIAETRRELDYARALPSSSPRS